MHRSTTFTRTRIFWQSLHQQHLQHVNQIKAQPDKDLLTWHMTWVLMIRSVSRQQCSSVLVPLLWRQLTSASLWRGFVRKSCSAAGQSKELRWNKIKITLHENCKESQKESTFLFSYKGYWIMRKAYFGPSALSDRQKHGVQTEDEPRNTVRRWENN